MPLYVVARAEDGVVTQVVTYSRPPSSAVIATWAAKGYRLVPIAGPRRGDRARAIARTPSAWRVRGEEIEQA